MIKVLHRAVHSFAILFVLSIIVSPIIFMVYFSFMDSQFMDSSTSELSTRWYSALFSNSDLLSSLWFTFAVSLTTALVSVVLGLFSGYWMARTSTKRKNLVFYLMTIPAVIPLILYGLGFLEFSQMLGIQRTPIAIMIAHVVVFSPLVFAYLYYVISQLNEDLENSARELGASQFDVISLVVRQINPNLIATAIIVFVLSWDEYIISWFVSGFQKTYAVHIRNMLESTFSPEAFSIGSLIALISFSFLFFGFKKSKVIKFNN